MPEGATVTWTTHPDGKSATSQPLPAIYKGGGVQWFKVKFRAGGVPTSCTATASW